MPPFIGVIIQKFPYKVNKICIEFVEYAMMATKIFIVYKYIAKFLKYIKFASEAFLIQNPLFG